MIAWHYTSSFMFRRVVAGRSMTIPSFHIAFLLETEEGEWYMQATGDREKIDVTTEEEAKAYVETLYRMGELP